MPSKFADYVQAGLPILAVSPKHGSVASFVDEFQGGWVVGHSPETICQGLEGLVDVWSRGELASLGSSRLLEYLGPEAVSEKVTEAVQVCSSQSR